MPNWKKVIVSGSDASLHTLNVTNGITGSLFGTASYAVSSSNTISASYAISSSYAISASQAGGALFAESASNSISASHALRADTVFPYAGIAIITGSLVVTSTIALDGTLSDYSIVTSSTAGSNNLFTQGTSSYTSAFFKYTVSNGANARSGEVMTVWNGNTTNYTDTSTTDVGDTSAVTCSVDVFSGDVHFNIQTQTSGWKLKSLATYM
jgi:hypothetical protein